MIDDSEARAIATWRLAREQLGGCITALEFGDEISAVVVGAQAEPERVIRLPLGVAGLARDYLAAARPGEQAIEAAIAEVEDDIMPLLPLVPRDSQCVSADPRLLRIAGVLEAGPAPRVRLGTPEVESAFNRWVSIALGRPASQDTIPLDADFAASLLALREWLHHGSFEALLVYRAPA